MNLVEQTRNWLSNNHITVPENWLQACLEWIQEENQGRNLLEDDARSLVYEQWLLSDLHELEAECLPNGISSASKFELNGTFALQIDSMLDVGLSYYSQQQKIKGTENANAKVSADEPTHKPWEQKPSRMLMFKLTDGKQEVEGMEYKPISCLTPQTQPGTKVLIHGRVLCRYGVLMLSEANIKNLGGEVDTLVESNSPINTLQAAMEASAVLANKTHRQEFEGSEVRSTKTDMKQSQVMSGQYNQSQGNTRQSYGNQAKVKKEPLSQRLQIPTTGNITRSINSSSSQQNGGDFDDDFIEDIDFDDDFEESCMQTFNNSFSKKRNALQENTDTNRQKGNLPKNKIKSRISDGNKQPIKSSQSTYGVTVAESLHEQTQQPDSKPRNSGACNNSLRNETFSRNSAADNILRPNQRINQSDPFVDEMDFDNDDIDFEDDDIDLLTAAEAQMIDKSEKQVCIASTVKKTLQESSNAIPEQRTTTGSVQNINKTEKQPSNTPVSSAIQMEQSTDQTLKRATNNINLQNDTQPPGPSKIQKVKEMQHMLLKSKPSFDVDGEYPFTYLSKVMSAPLEAVPTYHTVKAYISTLTGKLSSQDNKWTLSCKINDGTMAVDVDLSTKVLTEMIGFSPQEAQEMKKKIARDPSIKESLKKGLQQCQQKLIDLICLMELEMSTSNNRPVIVATKPLTPNTAHMLYNRVMSNWDKLG